MHQRIRVLSVVSCALFTLVSLSAAAQSASQHVKAPKPDLRAGGFSPSEIPNGEVTDVKLPGFHLTGARVETENNICQVVSYEVVSDNEIHLKLKGTRPVDGDDTSCTIRVSTAAGSASSWLVVDLTDAEEDQRKAHAKAAEQSNAAAFFDRTGRSWHITYAGGTAVTYTSVGPDEGGMPTFKSDSGKTIQIAVTQDNKVMMMEPGCMRSGKLIGAEVKNGQSQGECSPAGAWSATVSR